MVGSSGSSNYHVDYIDVTQHWHSQSQKYAGGDSLVTAIDDGWTIDSVWCESPWFAGMRSVTIYYFAMVRGSEQVTMPVIHTTYITALIHKLGIRVEDCTEYVSDNSVSTHD